MAAPSGPQTGKPFRFYVSTDGVDANAVIVKHGTAYSKNVDTSSNTVTTFDDTTALTQSTSGSETYDLTWILDPADPGAVILFNASINGTNVFIHTYIDGNVGFKQLVSVGGSKYDATPENLQTYNVTATGLASKTTATRSGYAGSVTAIVI